MIAAGRIAAGVAATFLVAAVLITCPVSSGRADPPPPADAAAAPADRGGEAAAALSGTLRPEQIDAVLAVLDDEQVRAAMRGMLLLQAAAAAPDAARREPNLLEIYRERSDRIAAAARTLPADAAAVLTPSQGAAGPIDPFRLFASVGGLILLGIAALLVTRRLLASTRRRLEQTETSLLLQRVIRGFIRVLCELVEIAAFALAVVVGYLILAPADPRAPLVLHLLLQIGISVLLIVKLSRLVLAPGLARLRLVPVSDGVARRVHWIIIGVAVLIAGISFTVRLLGLLGLPEPSVAAARLGGGVLVCTVLLGVIWTHHQPVTAAIRRGVQAIGAPGQFAGYWALAASVYVVGVWLLSVDAILRNVPEGTLKAAASLLLLLAVPVLGVQAHRLFDRLFGSPAAPGDDRQAGPAETVEMDAVRSGAAGKPMRILGAVWIALLVLAVLLTLRIWGVDPAEQAGIGPALADIVLEIAIVLLLGYIGYQLIGIAIDRRIAGSAIGPGAGSRAKRLATLLPLLRKFALVVVVVIVGLTILSSIGVQIGPLLAGAGVVGIAIGLGAQSLITDVLAGIFFLIDDAFSVGDYIEVGALRGTVESISIRSLKVRHHRGALHSIPFGQMKSLTNYTRDWSIMKLDFRVAADTDVDLVKKIVKQIGAELQADPALGPYFIEPLKSQGVHEIEDNALMIRVKYMSKPGEGLFLIRKEVYRRIRDAFLENGIGFASRGVTVRVENAGAVPPETLAAAADALDREQSHREARGAGG